MGANADTDSSVNDRLIINNMRLAVEAASLKWVEGEKMLNWELHNGSRFMYLVEPY